MSENTDTRWAIVFENIIYEIVIESSSNSLEVHSNLVILDEFITYLFYFFFFMNSSYIYSIYFLSFFIT